MKGDKFPPELLTPDEVRRLLRVQGKGVTPFRNRALIVVLWRSGLRVSEALALRQTDMDRERATVTVLHGKGDKFRVVGLDTQSWGYIDAWEHVRARLGHPPGLLFVTRSGGPVLPSYMRGLVPRLARQAGIERRVHPHALRRAFAYELAETGVPVPVISQALGHSSVATTAIYLTQIRNGAVLDAIAARPSWDTE